MHLLGIVAILSEIFSGIKTFFTPRLTDEYWANRELQHKDRMAGVSEWEIVRRAERGRYYLPKKVLPAYPKPHRSDDGSNKIVIENSQLHREDVEKHGSTEAYKWVKQGKYNLTDEEFQISRLVFEKKYIEWLYPQGTYGYEQRKARLEEISKTIAANTWDFRKTEASQQWEIAHDAENQDPQ